MDYEPWSKSIKQLQFFKKVMRTIAGDVAKRLTQLAVESSVIRFVENAQVESPLPQMVGVAGRLRSFHWRELDIRMHRAALPQELLQPIAFLIGKIAADERGLILRAMKFDEQIGALNADLFEEFRPLVICFERQEHRGRRLL
jgi:hypothetical protein